MNLETLKQRAKAFDYLFDAVVVTDLQGTIVDWNTGSEQLYGYTKEEAIGREVSMLHVPEDSARITEEVISAVDASGKWTGEIRSLHKDGRIGWIESMCVPIYDDQQQMIGALGINRDITARKNEAERLNYLAHYDQLTKIPNRYLLLDRVTHLIEQSKRHGATFTLLYVDLDRFKAINDSKGHAVGDSVLSEAALRIKQTIRNSDTVARVGGDEFVLILEGTSKPDSVSLLAAEIIKALRQPFVINDDVFKIGCSIGVAIYPEHGVTTNELLAAADKAMYRAKRKGGDACEF